MGVPKLYRWLSERYPLVNRSADALPKPVFDNLYLDLNGVIHYSSHAQSDFVENKSEQEIASGIFSYIERLFDIASPQKVLFIAIDGVAPRAKINQQRMRRFRSAHSRQLEAERRAAASEDPEEIFDSNCITPGTTFLERITDHLSYYIRSKVDSDAQWRHVEVILSGPQVPGEGEHKIMDFIRRAKLQPGYNPNTRHCLYGLDGDLMLLSTAAHEPHFALLREKVVMRRARSNRDKKEASLQSTGEFQFFHVSLLREYVAADLKAGPESRERVLDDFIFLSFFVGNDFLPPLPLVEIDDGGLEFLFQAYRAISMPREPEASAGDAAAAREKAERERPFLVDVVSGVINREFLVAVLRALVARESTTFEEKLAAARGDESEEESDGELVDEAEGEEEEEEEEGADGKTSGLKDDAILEVGTKGSASSSKASSDLKSALGIQSAPESSEEAAAAPSSSDQWRASFYASKKDLPMVGSTEGFEEISDEILENMVQNYIEGLVWVLRYYYHGVPSWSWFYGYHFAPLVVDIVRKLDTAAKITFTLDEPFTPLEQLMAVLPFGSRTLLPNGYQRAIEEGDDSIAAYFPQEFGFHLDEKNREWRNTPLIPFVDQALLKAFCAKHEKKLTPEEQKRNAFGPAYSYKYSADSTLPCPATLSAFQDIAKCHCEVTPYRPPAAPENKSLSFEPRLLPGANITVPAIPVGFPTLYALPCATRVDAIGVNIFGWNSRNDSLVLTPRSGVPASEEQFKACVSQLLGKPVLIWPFFEQGIVDTIVTKFGEFSLLPNGRVNNTYYSNEQLQKQRQLAPARWRSRYAVECTDPNLISLKLRVMKGMERTNSGKIAIRYEDTPSRSVPLQCVLHGKAQQVLASRDARYVPRDAPQASDTFKAGCPVVSLQPGNTFGLCGECIEVEDESVRVRLGNLGREPTFSVEIANDIRYKHTFQSVATCARMLKVGPLCLTRVAGSVTFRVPREGNGFRKTDLGLQLKYQGRKLRMWEYSKVDSAGKWLFSEKAVDLMREYRKRYPEVWEAVEADSRKALYSGEVLLGGGAGVDADDVEGNEEWRAKIRQRVEEIGDWLDSQPSASVPLIPSSIESLSQECISLIEEDAEALERKEKVTEKKINASNLFTPHGVSAHAQLQWAGGASSPASADAMELGDRVCYVMDKGPVCFGSRGSVVGLTPMHAHVVFDAVQLSGTTLGGKLRTLRGVEVPRSHLLNLSKAPQHTSGGGGSKKKGRGGGGKKKPANPFALLD